MIKVARVTQLDYASGRAKVALPERDNTETNWMDLPAFEYNPPKVGDLVRVAFDDDNFTDGILLGTFFHVGGIPDPAGETVCYKQLGDDVVFLYDKKAKVLQIAAGKIELLGDVSISGDLNVSGNLAVGGSAAIVGTVSAANI